MKTIILLTIVMFPDIGFSRTLYKLAECKVPREGTAITELFVSEPDQNGRRESLIGRKLKPEDKYAIPLTSLGVTGGTSCTPFHFTYQTMYGRNREEIIVSRGGPHKFIDDQGKEHTIECKLFDPPNRSAEQLSIEPSVN